MWVLHPGHLAHPNPAMVSTILAVSKRKSNTGPHNARQSKTARRAESHGSTEARQGDSASAMHGSASAALQSLSVQSVGLQCSANTTTAGSSNSSRYDVNIWGKIAGAALGAEVSLNECRTFLAALDTDDLRNRLQASWV